jgi:hypothetical protein
VRWSESKCKEKPKELLKADKLLKKMWKLWKQDNNTNEKMCLWASWSKRRSSDYYYILNSSLVLGNLIFQKFARKGENFLILDHYPNEGYSFIFHDRHCFYLYYTTQTQYYSFKDFFKHHDFIFKKYLTQTRIGCVLFGVTS